MRLPTPQLIYKLDALGEVALKKSPAFHSLFKTMIESEVGEGFLAGVVYIGLLGLKVQEEGVALASMDELIEAIHAATR